MYSRDPEAPARETINCGCAALPFMDGWNVQTPNRKPFSDEELRQSLQKRILQELA